MSPKTVSVLQKELDFLYRVSRSVTGIDIDDVLHELVVLAEDITGADSVLIYLLDGKHTQLTLRASKNPHAGLLKNIMMKLGEGITGWVAQHQKPVVISRRAFDDHRFKQFTDLPEDKYEAFLSVPIVNKHGVVGVINVQHKESHVHTPMEVNLLTAMGRLVGGTVENAVLIEQTLELKEALEMRKVLDKAKGIIMKKRGLSEDEAYQLLRNESMKQRKSLKQIAEIVITAENMGM